MPELLRPEPPRALAERARALALQVQPARLALGAGGALLTLAVGWWLVRPSPPPVEAGLPLATTAPAAPSTDAAATGAAPTVASASPGTIVVQAAGAVQQPGVYELPAGSRVIDLIDVAGGTVADAQADALALASPLADGQRVQVPRVGESVPPVAPVTVSPAAGSSQAAGPVDLNTATLEALDELPGIGPATAQAIVSHRERNGPFRTVDDLVDVRGIGEARLEALRELLVAG